MTATNLQIAVSGSPTVSTASASAIDLENNAYMKAFPIPSTSVVGAGAAVYTAYCEQKLYAHRARAHLLVMEVRCTNPTSSAITVTLVGPNDADSNDGLTVAAATTGLKGTKCWSGVVTVTEVNGTAAPVVGFCHTDTNTSAAATFTVPAGGSGSTMLLSSRYTTIDTDGKQHNIII